MSTSKTYPRSVTPGIETHLGQPTVAGVPVEAGVFCTIDWLRGTCPESRLDELVDFCNLHFGDSQRRSTGAKHFKHGMDWPNGVKVSHGHNSEIAMLDVRGEWLSHVSFPERLGVLTAMTEFGMKMTRVDLALDYMFQNRSIYAQALASCERDELCILRTYQPNPKFGPGGRPIRLLLGLGSRDSACCARIYDKGLEQNMMGPGYWERIECEFKGDKAPEIARMLAGTMKPEELIPDLVFGTFDFREQNGRSELARRPRVEWWQRLVGDQGIRLRLASDPTTFERWWEALMVSYGRPILRFAELLGVDPGKLFGRLTSGEAPSENPLSFEDDIERVRGLLEVQ